jgi:hypothetical protein
MKHFFSALLFLIVFGQAGNSQIVGKIIDKQPALTANRGVMIQNLEKTLKKQLRISAKFNSVEILTNSGNYYIVFRGSEYTTKLPLEIKKGSLVASAISCTTKSCASTSGCTPDWLAKSCSACDGGDCLKVTSSFQLGDAEVISN